MISHDAAEIELSWPEDIEEQNTFDVSEPGVRMDVFVSENCGITRTRAAKLIESGNALRNGLLSKPGEKLKMGDAICVTIPPCEDIELVAQDIPIDIVYEDGDFAVINKPQGLVVHPAPGHPDGTLVNALMYHLKDLSGIGGEMRPGIVHRIDKDTSGLLLVAKNDFAHQSLCQQIQEKSARRIYLAIVEGTMKEESGSVDKPIGRSKTDRKKMAICAEGKNAVTHWRTLELFEGFSLVECSLETGRTHQIRVHMAYINHPVVGDPVYGPTKPKFGLNAQMLHARKLEVNHPRTGKKMEFFAPIPEAFESLLEKLRRMSK